MVSCALFTLAPLWIHMLTEACRGEELPREEVLSWVRGRVLEGLGLEHPPPPPPATVLPSGVRQVLRRAPRTSRTSRRALANRQTNPTQDTSQIILFPSSDSSCATSATDGRLTYSFQPSMNQQEELVTSAHFWFYAGATANSSAPLFILLSPAQQQPLQAAEAPSESSSDGWTTYHLRPALLSSIPDGPFLLQVHCPACQCHADQPDKMPFLYLLARPRVPLRSARSVSGRIPWSPSAIDMLQRPSLGRPEQSDCSKEEIQISFEELGWDNWIVHPKVLTFSYCHGNCSAWDRTTAMLGITQCCAPVPDTMRSLRITTTSDGGYSFKYETLPNIIPEECTCI